MTSAIVRVHRLEERLVLSASPFTQVVTVIHPDQTTSSETVSGFWDLMSPDYANALAGLTTYMNGYNQAVGGDLNTAVGHAGPGDPYGSDCDAVTGVIDAYYAQAASTMLSLEFKINGLNDSYTDPSTGVAIDSTVMNDATAAARVRALYGTLQTAQARNQQILDDVKSSGTLGQCAKAWYYYPEIKSLANTVKAAGAELKLIRNAYPAAFK